MTDREKLIELIREVEHTCRQAERLKNGWCADSGRCCEYIDNLVKEME